MITYEEALEKIREQVRPLGIERIPLGKALHRVLSSPVVAPFDLPRFDNSAVDGYAVRGEGGSRYRVIGTLRAGDPASGVALSEGDAVKVLTGAPVPKGAEAVVMQEDVSVQNGSIEIQERFVVGQNVRRRGEEARAGAEILPAGTLISPAGLSILATLGISECDVYRLPRVSILVTGSELRDSGSELGEGQIYESNSFGLSSALQALGVPVVAVERVEDSLDKTLDSLRMMLEKSDLVLTSGGVSVGDFDLVRDAFEALGVRQVFWGVAIKPGKPVYFGTVIAEGHKVEGRRSKGGASEKTKLVFGLPGNPVSTLAVFLMLVRPALKGMVGLPCEPDPTLRARLGAILKKRTPRLEFARANLLRDSDGFVAMPLDRQGSHMASGLAAADALVHVPLEASELREGEKVDVTPIRWSWSWN